jgi:predicted methyltransferase
MRAFLAAAAAALLLGACAAPTAPAEMAAPAAPAVMADAANIAAAVADSRRPAEDAARDEARKPADMLAFAGVRPGMKVVDLLPGGGYFTRLFAVAVGPGGHVYAVQPPPRDPEHPAAVVAVAAQYDNAEAVLQDFNALMLPADLDLVWTSQNYHDAHIARFNIPVDKINAAALAALKPGGAYIVLDHAAPDGSGAADVETLHRIDQAFVRAEVEAAGFIYEAETNVLRNPADDRTLRVFDPAIRGHTDQFVMRFRKPG